MNNLMQSFIVPVLYLLSAVMFILGLKGLTRVRTARRGARLPRSRNIASNVKLSQKGSTTVW